MNNKINTIRPIDLTQHNMMIPKDRLPQRHFDENYNPNEKFGIVAMNRDGNKAEIQKFAKLLSQSKMPLASFWGIEN